jgi:ABC-type polysaccharide/polyol phosphate export permease
MKNPFLKIKNFYCDLSAKKSLILTLSVRSFKSVYFGSAFGFIWAIVEPLVYVFMLWFFMSKIMKAPPPDGYPYVPWLMASIAVWNFISQSLTTSTGAFRNYSFLIKRPQFTLALVPLLDILAAIYVHTIFVGILVVLLLYSGVPFSIYWLQALYYLFATSVLLFGLSLITASISPFLKDMRNIVQVCLQVGFWISPIFWSPASYPPQLLFLLKMNPLTYLLEGYRKSFLYQQPFWEDIDGAIYFWSIALIILLLGAWTYTKLRPHFGDVV